jgi:hypothetical protein
MPRATPHHTATPHHPHTRAPAQHTLLPRARPRCVARPQPPAARRQVHRPVCGGQEAGRRLRVHCAPRHLQGHRQPGGHQGVPPLQAVAAQQLPGVCVCVCVLRCAACVARPRCVAVTNTPARVYLCACLRVCAPGLCAHLPLAPRGLLRPPHPTRPVNHTQVHREIRIHACLDHKHVLALVRGARGRARARARVCGGGGGAMGRNPRLC